MENIISPKQDTALITGASSGIGLALAREFARHGHPLIIVAPVKTELDDVAARIREEFNVVVHTVAQDLAEENAADRVFDALVEAGVGVHILVNNAGLGQRGRFWETPLERDLEIIRVNVEAPIRLTKRFLPPMIERRRGWILNTASIAGFEPGPLLAVYHASKAFDLSWSEALTTELKDANTGVVVTTLCPGPTDTDFFPKADMVDTKAFQKAKVMAPQEVAEAAYKGLMKGERLVVPGMMNKAMVMGRRMMTEAAQARMNEKMYEETDPGERKRERGDVEAKASRRD
jgi:Short-chain dehydrogenases of various substrate specificities